MAREQEVDYRGIWSPFGSISITPSDTTVLVPICRKLYIGGPTVATLNTVVVRCLDGSTPSFSAIPGTTIDVQFDQVKSTGTTATLMVGLY
jgi:hypothetical protein